jgi:hypothetical protein
VKKMPESDPALKALKRVEEKVDEIHGMFSVSNRAMRKQVLEELVEYFTKPKPQKNAVNIFLVLDGRNSREWYIKKLDSFGIKIPPNHFSSECKKLAKLKYIEPMKVGKIKTYMRNPEYDRLGIPADLKKILRKRGLVARNFP